MRAFLFATVLMTSSAFATDHIDIKGLHLGMTKDEATAILNRYKSVENDPTEKAIFTIGGERLYLGSRPNVGYTNEVVDRIVINFYSSSFDNIAAAFKVKYPNIICRDSAIHNGIGTELEQTVCVLKTNGEFFTLVRYAGTIASGGATLVTDAFVKKQTEEENAKKNDL